MGVVYQARQVRLNRPCVLKMILAGAHADAEAVVRFLAEAEAVARLQHPNIVQIYHIGEDDGLPYFELEYVDGGSLDGGSTARRGSRAGGRAGRGARARRRRGAPPGDRPPRPQAGQCPHDGRGRSQDRRLRPGQVAGERLRADAVGLDHGHARLHGPRAGRGRDQRVGAPADVYALGAILYELLTGRPPFVGATILETLEQVRTTEPVAPSRLVPRLPRDLETIVLKCLQKDPGKRYDSAADLGDDLRRFLGGEPILARPIGPVERGWRWCRRNPVVAGLSFGLAATLVLATAASLAAYARMSKLARGEHAARLTAERETQAARDARVREAAQRLCAETNFRKARAAVDGYLTRVSESRLLKVPGLQPLRGELLQSALPFYRDFLAERGDDPTLRADLAATHLRIGRVQAELGSVDEARRSLKSAITAYRAEVAKDPQDIPLRTGLADAWRALGHVWFDFGGQDSAGEQLAACEANAELREGLARDRPDDADRRRDLADALELLAVGLDGAGRDGLPARLRGVEIRLALFLDSPDDPRLNFGLGESMNNLALPLGRWERLEEAAAMELRAEEYIRFAYERQPHMLEYGCDANTASLNAIRGYRDLGRKDEAVAEASKAVEFCRRLVRDHPAAPLARRHLAWALEELIKCQRDAGRGAEAARTGRELGQSLDFDDTPQWMFDAALWHARLARWADEWKQSGGDREQDEAHREADRAVETLRRAVDSGFADLETIRGGNDLDPLRGRADFQALVAGLDERLKAPRREAPAAATSVGTSATASASRAERVFRARVDRAAVLRAAGLIHWGRNHRTEARATMDELRVYCERLLAERPDDATLRAMLADTNWSLGRLDGDAGRLREADDAFARFVATAPREPAAYRIAASAYARSGRWDKAAETLARLVERDGDEHRNWCLAAAVRARAGGPGRYRELCRRMLDRFREPDDLEIAERMAKYCLLLPQSGAELEDADRMADRAVARGTGGLLHWAGSAKGLADYRRGRFAEALAIIEDAQASVGGGGEWTFQVPSGCVPRDGPDAPGAPRRGPGGPGEGVGPLPNERPPVHRARPRSALGRYPDLRNPAPRGRGPDRPRPGLPDRSVRSINPRLPRDRRVRPSAGRSSRRPTAWCRRRRIDPDGRRGLMG